MVMISGYNAKCDSSALKGFLLLALFWFQASIYWLAVGPINFL